MSPDVNRYYSLNPQHPEIGLISSSQVGDTQPTLLTVRVTGTYLDGHGLISNKPLFLFSSQSVQSPPPQDSPGEKKTLLRYCDLRGENLAVTICAERGTTRRMEREHRCIVRNVVFSFLCTTKSPPAQYNHPPG